MQYDSQNGKVKATTYPNGLTIENIYNNQGYLKQIKNAVRGNIYQDVVAMNALLQLLETHKVNEIIKEFQAIAEETGQLELIAAEIF